MEEKKKKPKKWRNWMSAVVEIIKYVIPYLFARKDK